ncbi:MAG: ComF family protein [Hyphomicrobiaceae bacterium]
MAAIGLRSGFHRLVRGLADVLVPPACLGCHVRLDQPDALCGSCWQAVGFIRPPLCDRLGIPLPYGRTGDVLISAAAAADPPAWGRARAAAIYASGSVVAGLIHAIKYADRHDSRRMLAQWLHEAGRELLVDADLIVPVPLTRRRLLVRQFNQSALLAREVSRLSGVPWAPTRLVKIRETRPQVMLSGTARRENLRGAFQVTRRGRSAIAGRKIVLVDDVITTGATAEAATKALIAGGAIRVDVLAVALVTGPDLVPP